MSKNVLILRKAFGFTHDSRGVQNFFLKFDAVNIPAVMMPNWVFDEICDTYVSIFRVLFHQSLYSFCHFFWQFDSSVTFTHLSCSPKASSFSSVYKKIELVQKPYEMKLNIAKLSYSDSEKKLFILFKIVECRKIVVNKSLQNMRLQNQITCQ